MAFSLSLLVMLFRIDQMQLWCPAGFADARARAFILHSLQLREEIIEKGGKISGVGGISRARLYRVSLLLTLCLPLALFRTTRVTFIFLPQLTRERSTAWHARRMVSRVYICLVWMHVLSTDFLLSCPPGKWSLTFVAVFHMKNRASNCAHARKSSVEQARRELINIAFARRPRPREIDLTRLNGALPERRNNLRICSLLTACYFKHSCVIDCRRIYVKVYSMNHPLHLIFNYWYLF